MAKPHELVRMWDEQAIEKVIVYFKDGDSAIITKDEKGWKSESRTGILKRRE